MHALTKLYTPAGRSARCWLMKTDSSGKICRSLRQSSFRFAFHTDACRDSNCTRDSFELSFQA